MIVFNLTLLSLFVFVTIIITRSIYSDYKKHSASKRYIILDDVRKPVMLSKDSTLSIRGIAILLMILHHFSQYFSPLGMFQLPVSQCGYALTAVFLFFSGYGCWFSFGKLEGVASFVGRLKAAFVWFLKHSFRLYLDFLIILLINIVLFSAFRISEGMSVKELLTDVCTFTLPTWVSWYPKIQIACYAILATGYVLSVKRKEDIVLAVTIVYIVVCAILRIYSMWYTSIICFPIGLFFARYRDMFGRINRKVTTFLLVFTSVAFCFIFVVQLKYLTIPLRMISVLFIPFILTFATEIINFDNKVFKTIGNISFEIYLIHLVLIKVFEKTQTEADPSLLAIILLAILIGYVVNRLSVSADKKLFKKSSVKS